jgi:hypothetical protein
MSKAKPNPAHLLFEKHLKELGLDFQAEYRFHPRRKWRWDYILGSKIDGVFARNGISVEIEGGFYRGVGGHNSINGLQRDMDKQNAGVMLGWRPLRFSSADVLRGRAKAFLAEHLNCGAPMTQGKREEGEPIRGLVLVALLCFAPVANAKPHIWKHLKCALNGPHYDYVHQWDTVAPCQAPRALTPEEQKHWPPKPEEKLP